jgi:hypothetical protein
MLDELRTLLAPKLQTRRARARQKGARPRRADRDSRVGRRGVLGIRVRRAAPLLAYFRGVPEIGPLLAGKLLGLILVRSSRSCCCRTSSRRSRASSSRAIWTCSRRRRSTGSRSTSEAARDVCELELDGRAHGGADAHGVRHGLRRRWRVHRLAIATSCRSSSFRARSEAR